MGGTAKKLTQYSTEYFTSRQNRWLFVNLISYVESSTSSSHECCHEDGTNKHDTVHSAKCTTGVLLFPALKSPRPEEVPELGFRDREIMAARYNGATLQRSWILLDIRSIDSLHCDCTTLAPP